MDHTMATKRNQVSKGGENAPLKYEYIVLICLHDDHLFLRECIRSFQSVGKVFLAISRLGWDGTAGDWQTSKKIGEEENCEILLCDKDNETDHRRWAHDQLRQRFSSRKGKLFTFIPDSDEIASIGLPQAAIRAAEAG